VVERVPGIDGLRTIFSIRGFGDGPEPAGVKPCERFEWVRRRCRGTTAIGGVPWPIARVWP